MNISSKISSINGLIAMKSTLVMSTMWCVYAFFIWSILPLAIPSLEQFAMYVSSTVIQLVALPLIMVGQNLLNKGSELRSQQDHEALMGAVNDLHHIMAEEDEEDRDLDNIVTILSEIRDRLTVLEAAKN